MGSKSFIICVNGHNLSQEGSQLRPALAPQPPLSQAVLPHPMPLGLGSRVTGLVAASLIYSGHTRQTRCSHAFALAVPNFTTPSLRCNSASPLGLGLNLASSPHGASSGHFPHQHELLPPFCFVQTSTSALIISYYTYLLLSPSTTSR